MRNHTPAVLLFFILLALTGCISTDPSKVKEKEILAEIEKLSGEASERLRSEEMRSTMIRLNELRLEFPSKRDDIERDAKVVKGFLAFAIEQDLKISEQWKKLLVLPLSSDYGKCVNTQIQIQDYQIMNLRNVIQELDVLSDPLVDDRLTLDSRVETIRAQDKQIEASQLELQEFVEQNCRKPKSD